MVLNTDILIVGGGLNGCAMALACGSIGLHVVIVDRLKLDKQKEPAFDGRAYALAFATQRMLNTLGVWDGLQKHSQAILDIKVSDGRAGEGASPYFLHFNHQELEEGPMGHMIEDRYLRAALLESILANELITYISETSVLSHIKIGTSLEVKLSDGQKIKTRLLIGCDGRNSQIAVRSGIKRVGWNYKQTSLVCAVEHEKLHHGTAHQFFTPAGPLAILPLKGGYRSSIVWTETTTKAAKISLLKSDRYLDCLRPVFGDFLGDITLSGQRFSYPLGLTIAHEFVVDNVALVGDAAHGLHPLAGQGLNLGLSDVAALSQVLAEAMRRGEDIGAINVLRRYQTWRRFSVTNMALMTDGINRIFSNDNLILRKFRDYGLAAINASPNLRRSLMRHAAGLSGELPKLMKGQKI